MKLRQLFFFAAVACSTFACSVVSSPADPAMDEHSYARPNQVRTTHLALDLELDFEQKRVTGSATYQLERTDPKAPLILDTEDLTIRAVRGEDGGDREFSIGEGRRRLGLPLIIQLEPDDTQVSVEYQTGEGADALQWLGPEQTAGGRHPFLFTQGQSIFTRSWIPCQDTPGVRLTYEASVRAPDPLTVVMSAVQLGKSGGAWKFELKHAIPAYLIALGCGDLVSRDVSDRCAVWAEPELIDASHWEFSDTERMIQVAEQLFGEYRWSRYDMLILPPAFPFGGMENPLLTFLTPTILAGDRSLVSIIAHELAHSWSGNLVTNATWRDFWLNEGFTVYFEKRIMEALYGEQRVRMEKVLDFEEIQRDIATQLEPWQQVLHIDLSGRHPDDGFSLIPYEKGALFLRRLEEVVGREALDEFLRSWFDEHAFQSVTTADFLAFLDQRLLGDNPEWAKQIDLDTWMNEPGMPDRAPRTTSPMLEQVQATATRFVEGAAPGELDTDEWVTQQWLHFLNALPSDLSIERMAELDAAFQFRESGNSEILFTWLRFGIQRGYAGIDDPLEAFLMRVGRRKFIQPLYDELVKTEAGMERARRIYAQARPRYHPMARIGVDRILMKDDALDR